MLLLTYDHEPFVEQAIQSVLAQQTTFDVELLISEDCSTDRTREVVLRYAEVHPARIRTFLSAANQNDNEVFLRAYREARGSFLAYLDGDDYWTSPHKLQRQVGFLLEHPDSPGCFHAVDFVDEHGGLRWCRRFHQDWLSIERLLVDLPITSPSALLRLSALGELPEWFAGAPATDWPLYLLASRSGALGYLDQSMAAHRMHRGGWWTGMGAVHRAEANLDFYDLVWPVLSEPLRRAARRSVARRRAELALAQASAGQREAAVTNLRRSLLLELRPPVRHGRLDSRLPRLKTVACLLRPELYRGCVRLLRRWWPSPYRL